MQVKIAVLDDHTLIAEAISSLIADHPIYSFYGGFSNSYELEQNINQQGHPDVLLLDINLPKDDGIELCRKFIPRFPGMHIIMITGLTQPAIVKSAMRTGASGFMLKNITKDEIINGLDTVLRGEKYVHREIQQLIVNEALYQHRSTDYIPKLTRREKEVLQLIVQEMTTQEIAAKLYISINTVETHRASLLQKTGAKNIAGLVKVAIEKGLTD
ncbi:MAG: response regulator transcription factor [Taibaiella sp.]|nr:response regulator transcription factor [Taibaiella sp.]